MSELYSSLLIKSAKILDSSSSRHTQETDMLIQDGVIKNIDKEINPTPNCHVIDAAGFHIGPGWCDIGTHCGEPGDEVNETLSSVAAAGRAGGYTHLGVFSNNIRPFDNRHIITDIKSQIETVRIIPISSVSKKLEGKELSEMLDLNSVGPALFTDGFHRAYDNAMFCKALEYAKQCNGSILTIPGATRNMKNGQINESVVSAQMGIPGIPGYEEVATLSAELSLVSYTKGQIFVHLVSTDESVSQIRYRIQQGLPINASVSALHLLHTEQDVINFDENFKVLPPLRQDHDRLSLIKALREGTLQVVVSNHQPISSESKEKEFGESPFGAIGLETTFLSLMTAIPDASPEEVNDWMSLNPRHALGLSQEGIKIGNKADITIFSTEGSTNYDVKMDHSLSRNSPYRKKLFNGRILGSVLGNSLYLAAKSNQ